MHVWFTVNRAVNEFCLLTLSCQKALCLSEVLYCRFNKCLQLMCTSIDYHQEGVDTLITHHYCSKNTFRVFIMLLLGGLTYEYCNIFVDLISATFLTCKMFLASKASRSLTFDLPAGPLASAEKHKQHIELHNTIT